MNKEEVIIKTCPHVSYTDYGVWACRLYKPMDKNSFVKFGTCGANSTCPYKIAELKTQECEKYIKALEEIEEIIKSSTKDFNHIDWEAKASHALTAVDKISDIINKAKDGKNDNSININ